MGVCDARFHARRGELLDVLALPGFIAERDHRTIGLATYRLENDECELAFIATLERHAGVGTALLNALLRAVSQCDRIWLVTTNDNLEALRFYQRRGFVLSALRLGAADQARVQLKPQISTVGEFGIPLATKSNSSCGESSTRGPPADRGAGTGPMRTAPRGMV